MSKAILEREIIIKECTDNYSVSGYLSLRSSETIDIDMVDGTVFFEARGRMSSQKTHCLSFTISGKKTLQANESYKIPFSFELYNVAIGTYNGKNVSFSYKCEVKIHVEDDDIGNVDRSLFSKIKSFVTSDDSLKVSTYFHVEDKTSTYDIVESTTTLDFKTNFLMSLAIGAIFAVVYLFMIPEFNEFYAIVGVLILIVLILGAKMYVKNALGVVTMETLRDQQAFLCTIKKTKNFNLAKQYVYYQIIEKVVDDRGTSSSTYRSTLYTSEKKKMSNHREQTQLKFLYPTTRNWHSNDLGDASIYWKMLLKGTSYLGFVLIYECEFIVMQRRQVKY